MLDNIILLRKLDNTPLKYNYATCKINLIVPMRVINNNNLGVKINIVGKKIVMTLYHHKTSKLNYCSECTIVHCPLVAKLEVLRLAL